jgi:hypothetical protein
MFEEEISLLKHHSTAKVEDYKELKYKLEMTDE